MKYLKTPVYLNNFKEILRNNTYSIIADLQSDSKIRT